MSDVGGPAAFDVSVVTAFRDDPRFVSQCATTVGHAASTRHDYKLEKQYPHRTPGVKLWPLVVEDGGRWHPSVPGLIRKLAREYVSRTAGLGTDAVSVIVDRWASRLSAILIRGNGAAVRALGLSPCEPPLAYEGGPGLACCIPEGDCAYELLVP